jgi:Mg/Co/Ni transporter MgtE
MVAFWGTFAYSMIAGNVKLAMAFGQIIAAMVGVTVPIMIIQKLRQFFTK